MDRTVLYSILFVLFATTASAEKVLRYMPTEYTLWSDNEILNYTFSMDKEVPYVNVTAKLLKEVKNVDIHCTGSILGKKDPSYFFNFNTTYNLCSLLAWKDTSPIGIFVFQYLKELGSLPDNCPIPKGLYGFHNIWIPEDPITASLPEVDFNFNIQVFATTVDGSASNKMIMNDFWKGEGVLTEVTMVKKGVLSYIPKISAIG